MSINKCILIGNLTRDPEIKHMPNGDAVTNASIACNERWKSKDGTPQEKVEFINLVFYRRLAEIAGEFLHKGSMIYVEGKLSTRKWQDKEGKDRYTTEIIVNEMKMLSGKQEVQSAPAPAPAQSKPASNVMLIKNGSFADLDDDIPFN